MSKRFFYLSLVMIFLSLFASKKAYAVSVEYSDFSHMKKIWCTVDYKHWATSYYNQIGYDEIDFYLYLDENNKKIYNQNKEEVEKVLEFGDKQLKFVNTYRKGKRTITETYTLDRYTGRARGSGTMRHDYGKWASITYENRDFDAKGQCASVDEDRKF